VFEHRITYCFDQSLVEQQKVYVLLKNRAIFWKKSLKNQEKNLKFQTQRICHLE
jgi:hypothetical protein